MCFWRLIVVNESDNFTEVSIICNTYNQVEYIKDALEGFVRQKTNFNFEVLVHDDASTDGTQDIIKLYESNYPKIIKGYYENENQYSKHNGMISKIQRGRVTGRFVALCEGDDYWIDENKLQKQYEFLTQHPEYAMCATYAKVIDARNNAELKSTFERADRDISINELIAEENGRIFPTVSVFMRSDVYLHVSSWRYAFPIGDSPAFIDAALQGKVRLMSDTTCVYRLYANNSWTNRMQDISSFVSFKNKMIHAFELFNLETNQLYNDSVKYRIKEALFSIAVKTNDYKTVRKSEYRPFYNKISQKNKISLWLRFYFPRMFMLIQTVKKRFVRST